MKKFLMSAVAVLCMAAGTVQAGSVVYNKNLVDESALAISTTYTLDLGASQLQNSNIDRLSAQANYAQAAPAAATITDGVASTATITISSYTALRGAQATNTLRVVTNASLAGVAGTATVYVASNTFLSSNNVELYFDGRVITSNTDYEVGATSATTATNLAAAITAKNWGFTASASGSTVTITCSNIGVYCNSKTVASSASTRLVASGTPFSGGIDNVYFTLNGERLTQGIQWTKQATSSATMIGIVNYINTYTPLSTIFTATTAAADLGVATITVRTAGYAGNAYTLTSSSNALLAAGGATFSNGVTPAQIVFNLTSLATSSVVLTEGTDFNAITSSQVTAGAIKNAIDANSILPNWISVSTAAGALVNLTAKYVGAKYNFGIQVSTPNALPVTNNAMYGGTDTDISTTAYTFYEANHTMTTALPVLFTKSAGNAPGVLGPNSTYYTIVVDDNNFAVASSSTNAIAGTKLAIATQTATGGGTFAFTPLAYSASPAASFKWQMSNDNSNWSDINVSSVTVSSPSTTVSSTFWDFGAVNFRFLRLFVLGPQRGGLYLVVPVIGRSSD